MAKKFNIDFNKSFKFVAIGYAALLVIGIVASIIFGVKLDINFKGGTVVTYNYTYNDTVKDLDTEEVKTLVQEKLSASATVKIGRAHV